MRAAVGIRPLRDLAHSTSVTPKFGAKLWALESHTTQALSCRVALVTGVNTGIRLVTVASRAHTAVSGVDFDAVKKPAIGKAGRPVVARMPAAWLLLVIALRRGEGGEL